jgi:hypothetical protein
MDTVNTLELLDWKRHVAEMYARLSVGPRTQHLRGSAGAGNAVNCSPGIPNPLAGY